MLCTCRTHTHAMIQVDRRVQKYITGNKTNLIKLKEKYLKNNCNNVYDLRILYSLCGLLYETTQTNQGYNIMVVDVMRCLADFIKIL